MRGKLARLCTKCVGKLSRLAVNLVLETVICFVATWCWNQTSVQEMRQNVSGLLKKIRWLNRTIDRSNPTVNQLLGQIENEICEVIELLNGDPTPVEQQNARNKCEKIRAITNDLKQVLGWHVVPVVVTIKPPQFKPVYLRRRTRIQVLTGRKISPVS